MKKGIFSKIILLILICFILYILWLKSPLCSSYFYSKGKDLYNKGLYNESVRVFERALSADPSNSASRFMYVQALSRSVPDYSVQESLYKMSKSETNDSARTYAKSYVVRLKSRLLEGLEDNYIYNAMLSKDIVHWNIESFPLKVYIEKANDVPEYYNKSVEDAFIHWMRVFSFIRFTRVNDEKGADIVLKYAPYSGNNCQNGVCKHIVAVTYPVIDKHHRLVNMDMTIHKTNYAGENYSKDEIYNSTLHEIGHALGVMGHSDVSEDVMYSSSNSKASYLFGLKKSRRNFSKRDINTVKLLYRLAPTITNTKVWYNEDLYYAPLILGNDDEIIKNKLAEYRQYIEKYPNFASGYINISSLYSSLGEDAEAFKAIEKAEILARSQNEKYLVEYNRAVLYYNKQNFSKALEHAQKAKAIKSGAGIDSLIEDIENSLK